jgi:hypothetical protein
MPARPGGIVRRPQTPAAAGQQQQPAGKTHPEMITGGSVSQPVQAVTEAAQQQIGGFHPQSKSDLHAFFSALPDLLREGLGRSLHQAAENMSSEHVHPSVIESLHELGTVVEGIAGHAEEVMAAHLSRHEIWLNE